jgi:hypothetical protein
VDGSEVLGEKFVDKPLVPSVPRPVLFVLPEGAVGTVRQGEE